jgi:hypothetical protein
VRPKTAKRLSLVSSRFALMLGGLVRLLRLSRRIPLLSFHTPERVSAPTPSLAFLVLVRTDSLHLEMRSFRISRVIISTYGACLRDASKSGRLLSACRHHYTVGIAPRDSSSNLRIVQVSHSACSGHARPVPAELHRKWYDACSSLVDWDAPEAQSPSGSKEYGSI